MKSVESLKVILIKRFSLLVILFSLVACKEKNPQVETTDLNEVSTKELLIEQPTDFETPEGMVWVSGKTFVQGAKDADGMAMPREKPGHQVSVDGFFIDETEVTNAEFRDFVEATNYITIAERPIDWEEMKKDLPEGTPKPADSILQPGSLVFNKDVDAVVNMQNYGQWWKWQTGADWKHPYGPNSNIEEKDNFPVVHVAYEDALAYCKWANRRLPTEAEWERAAQGNNNNAIYTWGNDAGELSSNANTWNGTFPTSNTGEDGFKYIAPVKSFPANSIGIYDMSGNVWEWTSDTYNDNYYKTLNTSAPVFNPQGATEYYNPQNPYQVEMIMKGGSYLCHASYCSSYRISARMSTSRDSGSDHLGFRTVVGEKELKTYNK
ncbi:formylglycine-generating enzyme family protein [Nonlabens sp. Hel1_33_55]|uniref:formylglycine-generating enzyme family protein n=1 Tax=Nonlabens sp. Hel1_33_55 TaxID=1336802 RepID=UPI000B81799B|nr:formylglycine-generating enzyme family protein [Nonlabens sp. Hel1_33_55]